MKLKQFEDVNTAARTRYAVFDQDGEYIETFENFLLDENGNAIPYNEEARYSYRKRKEYAKAKVSSVSFSRVFNSLTVQLIVNRQNGCTPAENEYMKNDILAVSEALEKTL